jgi:hypothetical protein
MRLYCVTYKRTSGRRRGAWFGTIREADSAAKRMRATKVAPNGEPCSAVGNVVVMDVPTRKPLLVEWLNRNAR